jgi:thymidylate kinase
MVTDIIVEHSFKQQETSRNKISKMLFYYLNQKNVNYAFLEPANDLCEIGNIKLAITQNQFKTVSTVVEDFCKQADLILVQTSRYETTSRLFVLAFYDAKSQKFIDIKIHFLSGYKIEGFCYLTSDELLNDPYYSIEKKYWRVNDVCSFIYYLIESMKASAISEAQFCLLNHYWTNAGPKISEKLKNYFDHEYIQIISSCFFKKDITHLNANLSSLYDNLCTRISRSFRDILAQKTKSLKNLFYPSGIVVGILGRDGCGKSTFVNEITESIATYFDGIITFKKFPSLLYKKEIFKKKEAFDFSKPHLYEERGRLASFLKLNLILIEFLFGYWLKIFPSKTKSRLVLYDRYFIDIMADPRRYRIKKNKFFIKLFHYVLPKPDLWIILDLPSEILLKRKQELSFEMAEKLRYEYLNLKHFLPNSIIINNKEEINKTVNMASSFIFNFMHKRVARHHS